MVMDSNSVHERVTRLCEKILKGHTPTYPLERRSSNVIIKDLRALSYGILLNKSQTSCTCVGDGEELDAVSKILAYSFKLHQCHLTDQAIRLYDLTNSLPNSGGNSTIEAILLFLENLAGEVQDCVYDTNVKNESDIFKPVNTRKLKIPSYIHVKPYQEFPPQMFEPPISLNVQKNSIDFPFSQEPGVGLALLGKFGAPVKQRQCPPLEFLNFPDLAKPRDLVIPKEASPQEQQFKDEGYVSPSQDNAMTVSCVSSGVEPLGSEMWEMALMMDLPALRTWETLGSLDPPKEKPFLTESRIDCVHKVWRVMSGDMFIYMNKFIAGRGLLTDLNCKQLVQDLKLLLIGMPSQTFHYNQEGDGFVMKSGVCVDGVTPDTLRSFCKDFLVSGTCCLRLRKLVERNMTTGSHVQEGLMFQALCGSVRSYLQFYRSAVIMLPEDPVLTRLRQQVDGLHIQMTSLGHLCKVHPNTSQEDVILPEGVALLAYLYQEICKVTRKDIACILYSSLQACCQVYFSFLQKWLFEGLCQDAYTEFFIQEQTDLMTCRQREYWSRGYYMLEEAVPGFLQGLEVAIFQCGKTLNLLKLCNPQDALCVVLQSGYPTIHCCLHSADLQQLEDECLSYQHRALAACGKPLDVSHFFQCSQEEEQAFQVAVQIAQQASLQKIKLERDMKASRALAEKRAQLAVLKEQMEMAEARRIDNKRRQLEEDEQHAREAAEREQETARRAELEKAEMVRYYSALSEVAEKRRQHAEWRIERMKLQEKRLELKSNDTESVMTIRSPNNNEDLQDINSNLSDMNTHNNMRLEGNDTETQNNNVDTRNNTEPINTLFTNYKTKMSDTQNNIKDTNRQLNITKSIIDTNNSEVYFTESSDSTVGSEDPPPCKSENQIVKHITDNKSNKVETHSERNKETHEKAYPVEVMLEPRSFPTEDVESADSNMSFETAVTGLDSHSTMLSESKLSVSIGEADEVAKSRSSISTGEADQVPKSKLSVSIGEADEVAKSKSSVSIGETDKVAKSRSSVSTGEADEVAKSKSSVSIGEADKVAKSKSSVSTVGAQEDANTKLSVSSGGTEELIESKLSAKSIGVDKRLIYKLHMPLEDAPLVNITDSVLPHVKNLTAASSVDMGTADMSSINIALQKSILVPLKIQTGLVNSALLKLFLQDQELLSHLHSLRSYFFLLDGEFGRNVTSMLFERIYQVARPVDLLNCVALNSILSKALTRPDPNVDRLSFDVKYIPPHFSFSSPLLLDCIMLQYKVAWPLNIIFTEAALHKYDDIFGFLLRLRRISWVLEEAFHCLKREAEARPGLLRSPQYHRLQLYRHEMTHFVRALQNYVTATVLQASWVEFLKNLQNAHTLDDLYRTHVAYIKMVLFRCLLNKQSSSIQKALLDTLKMILKFHGQLRSQAWQLKSDTSHYEHPRFNTLVQIYDCFHNLAVFTFKFATKLASTGYQPHLLDLLQMLNMNGFYPDHF